MLTFHYFIPRDRSGRVRWLLEELGLPYRAERLDYEAGAARSPEYLRVHPLGAVPALQTDVGTIFESGAICLYIADHYSLGQLAPTLEDPRRARYLQWMFFGPATLDHAVSAVWNAEGATEDAREHRRTDAVAWFDRVATVISEHVEKSEFLVGEFTAADVVIGLPLFWAERSRLLEGHPSASHYLGRLKARPAAQLSGIFTSE